MKEGICADNEVIFYALAHTSSEATEDSRDAEWVVEGVTKDRKLTKTEELRCNRIPDPVEQQLQSTQQLLHTKVEELEALNTQYRVTHDKLLRTQEQFSTQQQALSDLQYTAEQREEQLQARGRENVALTDWVETLQSKIPPLEQAKQAAVEQIVYLEQRLQSKQAQLQSLTEVTHLQIPVKPKTASVSTQTDTSSMQPTQTGLQAGVRAQQVQFRDTSTQNVVDDVGKPGTSSLTGKKKKTTTHFSRVLSLYRNMFFPTCRFPERD